MDILDTPPTFRFIRMVVRVFSHLVAEVLRLIFSLIVQDLFL